MSGGDSYSDPYGGRHAVDVAYGGDYDRKKREDTSSRRDRHDMSGRSSRRDRSRSRERSRRDDRDRDHREDRRDHRDRDRDRDRRDHDGRRDRDRDRDVKKERRSESPRGSERSERRERKSRKEVVPLHLRPRKLNNWDLAPVQFPGMTAMDVKASGAFPLPGQATRLTTGLSTVFGHDLFGTNRASQGAAGPVAQTASIARQARRLYVGNIPYGINEDSLMDFFNSTMSQLNVTTATGSAVIACQLNHDKNYAFIEFRSPEEATAAMAFDGITFAGQSLKIRRPKDYQAPMGGMETPPAIHVPGVVSTNVPDTPNKIFVGGLPPFLNDEQVMELLKSFGELRAFNLVKDGTTGMSKGFAFCEYVDPNITDIACQGLNGMELGDKKLVVQRASVGATTKPLVSPTSVPTTSTVTGAVMPTTVLLLLNMVTREELLNDDDYMDIMEDIRDECGKYGVIKSLVIPRPGQGGMGGEGSVGKIFVQFQSVEQAQTAMRSLAGRRFADRTVVASYYDEGKYLAGEC
ncbi:U2 small nuclear RNA auxiliary factor 2 [Gaertneriomyces sp. JEL0708]|nr:U2 small nuclear RNA auxiliary factor 2 [Gaertneriomyces sp. JEL0708]